MTADRDETSPLPEAWSETERSATKPAEAIRSAKGQAMHTLYLDCADTLVTWNRVFNARGEEAWQPNWAVVAAAERWQRQGLGGVVVWSEKGVGDAELWARRLMPQLRVECRFKDVSLPLAGDVCIDDVSLSVLGVCYHPNQSFLVARDPT
jgi:hypothetical protein